jgi:hypothetical protein
MMAARVAGEPRQRATRLLLFDAPVDVTDARWPDLGR